MDVANLTDIIFSLLTLTVLEVILGIDNLVFISITTNRLPVEQQPKARRIGLMFAWMTRLVLLASAVWISQLVTPLFSIGDFQVSGRDLLLAGGGLFLLYKATVEIHNELEPSNGHEVGGKVHPSFAYVIAQIAILDIVFSLDSVITAIGLTQSFWIMATAITIAILMMIFSSEPLSRFVSAHPTVRMLALSFLILIGVVLVADGLHQHIPRGYIYFSVTFSILVEMLNMRYRKGPSKTKVNKSSS